MSSGTRELRGARGDCPKNMRLARATGQAAQIIVSTHFRTGLQGLADFSHIHLIGWFGPAKAESALQLKPSHLPAPRGVFALRSPVRPNPLALSIAKITALDVGEGVITLDALDWFDGTSVLDIKPYYPSTDSWPEAKLAADTADITRA